MVRPAHVPPVPGSLPRWPRLVPPAEGVQYEATTTWEEYVSGAYKTTTISKRVTLQIRPHADCYEVDFRATPPIIQKKGDLEPLEELAQQLAALYEWIVVQVSPTGQLLALRNHEAVLRRWEELKTEWRQTSSAENPLIGYLIGFCDQQLQSPANLLASLQFDYLYQALLCLLPEWAAGSQSEVRPVRGFPQFFDKDGLWFAEHVSVLPAEAVGLVTLTVQGALDREQTNVAAIARRVATTLRGELLAAPEAATDNSPATARPVPEVAAEPHFGYQATYILEEDSGLPVHIALSVYARLAEIYNKEYTLLLERR